MGPATRRRTLTALAAIGALAFAGCAGDDDSDSADDGADGTETTDDAGDNGGTDPGGSSEAPESGVAASVGPTEITVTTVEDVYDDLASLPAVQEQLEGDEGDQLEASLHSQILGQLVVQEIIVQAAEEDHGLETTPEDLDAALDEFSEQAGGDEELDAQLEASGLTRNAFIELELPLTVTFRDLQEEFGINAPTPQGEEPSAEEVELQNWSTEKLQEADVDVDEHYGTWNPETGQIEPGAQPATSEPPDGDGTPGTSEPSSGDAPDDAATTPSSEG